MSEQHLRKQVDTILHKAHEAWQKPQVRKKVKSGFAIGLVLSLFLSLLINFWPFKTSAASYTGKQIRTIEYVLGGGTDTTSRTTGTTVYAGSSWNATKGSAGTKTITIPGSGILVKNAYLEVGYIQATAANTTNVALTLDVPNGPAPGTSVQAHNVRGTIVLANSGLSSYQKLRGDVSALFDRQTDSQFNSGLAVVGGVAVTGPTRALTTLKLVITYEQDYSTTVHNEVKTVRFALDSTNGTDTGTRTAVCAAGATCSFSYNANIPDATADANIQDVWFEIHAEAPTSAATAPSFTPQINGGTAGTSHSAVDTLTDDMNMNVIYRPAVGSPNFQRNTNQQLDIINGATVPLNAVGGELVVTYTFSTGAATQTDTVQYFMNQMTTSPSTTRQAFSQTINISNTGYSAVDIWFKVRVPSTETLNVTVDGTVGAGTQKSNVYAVNGSNTVRAGDINTIYYDMAADASFLTNGATLAGGITFSSATGDGPCATEAFITFTWSGSSGGTVTKTVLFNASQQADAAVASLYWNREVIVDLPETVTKTYRSVYVNAEVNHSQATNITAGTFATGVDGTITTVTENGEEGTTTTAESYNTTMLHPVSNTIFSGGATISWTERSFIIHNTSNQNNTYSFTNSMIVTYDAALGSPNLQQNYYRWRDDSTALDTDGGWVANQNTAPTLSKSTTYRVRIEVANTGAAPASRYPYQLEYGVKSTTCSAATYLTVPITPTTEHFEMVPSSQYADEALLNASRLTATGTFTNGRGVEEPSNTSNAITLTNNYYTEIEYAIQATTNATDGGSYCFRLTNLGSTTNFTYTNYAEAQIATSGLSISGTCDQWDQATDCVDDGSNAITVAFGNTVQAQTDATVDGAWQITGLTAPAANTVITIFINGESTASERAVAVTKYNGSGNITGVALYQRHLVIGSNQNNTLSNLELANYDYSTSGNDVDVIFDVDASNNLNLDNLGNYSDERLTILSGNTYRPDSGASRNINTNNFQNLGTVTTDSSRFYVSGNWANSGTFTTTTGGVTFNGTTSYNDTAATKQNIGAVILNGTSVTLDSSITLNTLSITAGTFNMSSSGYILKISGTGSAASVFSSSGTFNPGTNSLVQYEAVNSGGNVNIATVPYNNLEFAPASSETYAMQGNLTSSNAITGNLTIGTNATLDTISGYNIDIAGNWTNNGGTFTANTSTVNFNGSSTQTIGGSATTTFNNLTTSNTANATTGIATNIGGALTIGNGSTFTNAGHAMTVTGTTTIGGGTSGSLVISNSAGTKIFTGLVTTAAGSTWNNSGNSPVTFRGGIANNASATFTAGSGVYTFDTNNQALTGTLSIPSITVTAITLTNNNTLTCSMALSGTGGLTQSSNATLNIGGTSGISTLTATSSGNTVDYNGAAQTVHPSNYANLTLSGSGTKTLQAGTTNINGNFTLSGTASTAGVNGLTISGNVTLGSGTTFTAGSHTYNVAGNWTNNGGTFTANTSTVNFNGADSSIQNLSGNNTFNNLVFSTASNTAGRTIRFTDGSTTTVSNTWTVTGFLGKVITLTRTGSSSAWDINPTIANVTYSNVSWSNSSLAICATYSTNGGNNNSNWSFSSGASCNTAPNNPSSLSQKKTNDTVISTGGWINETSVKFTATASDTDNPDTLYLCVEKDILGTNFSNTEDLCGAGVSYSGSPVTLTVTITGITDANQYHWQARVKDAAGAYSSWVSYGGNAESERDFGIDTTAPAGGTVKDGTGADQDYNDGSLTQIAANWTGTEPNSGVSGLQKYEYAIRRLYDGYYWSVCNDSGGSWQFGENWCDNSTNTSFTRNGMNLSTGVTYYVSLKTYDNAGNIATISSNGQQVLPTLSFSISSASVTFANLNNNNNWTDTKTTTITTSTNASSGYVVTGFINQLLTSTAYPSQTIQNFIGTWASPQNWTNYCKDDANDCGYGYTSSDTLVQGSNRFAGGTLYCAFSTTGPGNIVADHTEAVNGSTGAVSNEQFTITHKVSVSQSQPATTYQTLLTVIVTANF